MNPHDYNYLHPGDGDRAAGAPPPPRPHEVTSSSSPLPRYAVAGPGGVIMSATVRDVLNGRGQGVQRHPGNVKYRTLVFVNKVRESEKNIDVNEDINFLSLFSRL
jgi:hypothetical protein